MPSWRHPAATNSRSHGVGYPATIDSPLDEGQGEVHVAKKSASTAKGLAKEMKTAPIEHHPAKDILRASGLSLLPQDDPG